MSYRDIASDLADVQGPSSVSVGVHQNKEDIIAVEVYPSVLVLLEKDDAQYMLINREEELNTAALAILKSRWLEGRYNGWYGKTSKPPKPLGFQGDAIQTLPAALQHEAKRCLRQYNEVMSLREEANRQEEAILKILNEKNGSAAWEFLERRSREHEYESIKVVQFIDPNDYA